MTMRSTRGAVALPLAAIRLTAVVSLALLIVLAALVAWQAAADQPGAGSTTPLQGQASPNVLPVAVSGRVVALGDGWIGVQEPDGDEPVAFVVGADTELVRDGQAVVPDSLRPGDRLRMTVDGRTGRIVRLEAEPAPDAFRRAVASLGWLVPVLLIVVAAVVWSRQRSRGWLTVANLESLQPRRSLPRVQRLTACGRGRA